MGEAACIEGEAGKLVGSLRLVPSLLFTVL